MASAVLAQNAQDVAKNAQICSTNSYICEIWKIVSKENAHKA